MKIEDYYNRYKNREIEVFYGKIAVCGYNKEKNYLNVAVLSKSNRFSFISEFSNLNKNDVVLTHKNNKRYKYHHIAFIKDKFHSVLSITINQKKLRRRNSFLKQNKTKTMTMKISKKVNFIAFLLISIIFIFEITYSMLFEDTCNLKIPGGIIIFTAVLFVISSISYFLRKEENNTTSYCPITFYISGNSENGFIMTYKAFTFMDYNYYRGEFKTLEECYEHAKNVCKLKENAYPVVKYLVIGHLELGPDSVGVYSDCFSIACVGRDEDEAKKLFSDAVIMHFEGLVEDGEWVPEKYEISFEYDEIKFEHQGVTGIVRNNQELGIPNNAEDIHFTGEITNLGSNDITFEGDSYISFHKAFIDSAELFIKKCKSQCMYSDNKRKIVFVENSKYGYSANCADRRVSYIGFGDSIEECVENFTKNTQELDCEFEFRVMVDVHIGYSENLYSLYSKGYFSIFIENKENILSETKNILSAAAEYHQKTFSEIPIRHHVKFSVPESLKDYVETFVIDVDGSILTSNDF